MARTYECTVTRVVDGDTLDVEVDLGFAIFTKQRVRLSGVDTPEIFRPSCERERAHGMRAKEFVEELCLGKKCTLVTDRDRKCKYGRYLGTVYAPESETSINNLLVRAEMAKLECYESADAGPATPPV